MKFKPLTLLVASAGLLVACGSGSETSTSQAQESSSTQFVPTYLTFVNEGKLRIDLFDVDVNFSYGNTALSQSVNTVDFDANSFVTVNQNSQTEKYYVILFAESSTRHTIKYLTPDGRELMEFVQMASFKNFYKDFVNGGRGYLAISTGESAKWAKGLNEKFDAEVEAWTKL